MASRKKIRIKGAITVSSLKKGFFDEIGKKALFLVGEMSKQFAKDTLKEIKSAIEDQKYKWPPLSHGYLKTKRSKGLDERILIATRNYLDYGIGILTTGNHIYVGPLPGIHKPSGLSYSYLAAIHEYGTMNIPARQLYRPVSSIMVRKSGNYKNLYHRALVRMRKEAAKANMKTKKLMIKHA